MSSASPAAEAVRQVLTHPTGGVVGLVDDLLTVCREHQLQLDWQAARCRVRSAGSDREEFLEVSLRKSVFRMILARVAALCNERIPNSVSPYGGRGELSVGPQPLARFRVLFANTPDEQKLELKFELRELADGSEVEGRFENPLSIPGCQAETQEVDPRP